MTDALVTAYAATLVDLVRLEQQREPERYGRCRSWEDLHDVCDANEFLIEADDAHSVDTLADPSIANAAVPIAERTLWPPTMEVLIHLNITVAAEDTAAAYLAAAAYVSEHGIPSDDLADIDVL